MTRGLKGVLALSLVVFGLGFIATSMWPFGLGDANWEVSAFGEMALSGAVPLLGLGLLGGWAAMGGRKAIVFVTAILCAFVAVLFGLGVVVLGLDLPLVLAASSGGNPGGMLLRVLVAKTGLLSAVYCATLLLLAGTFSRSFLALRRG